MKPSVVAASLIFASSTTALVGRAASCCFGLTATGGPGGPLGQLSDGQNRIGQGLPAATYCINNGAITDGNGRGCILTPPTTQFQCDAGASPTAGFAIGCDGSVTYDGNTGFSACPTGDNGGFNIYTTPPAGQQGCVPVTLNADSCQSGCLAPSPAPTPEPRTCPTILTSGGFEYPHLIVPVDSSNPNAPGETSYNGTITPTISSIFNFDIPSGDAGMTCSLVFDFPLQSQLQTSSFTFSGSGQIDFSQLDSTVSQGVTYASIPGVKTDYGVTTVAPGNSYVISTFACPANQAVSYELKSVGGTYLNYFQDYNPSPIGLYITKC